MALDKLENKKLAIIGSGHIAQALVSGLVGGGIINPGQITVANPSGLNLKMIKRKFGVNVSQSNSTAVTKADWIWLAVKPLAIKEVIEELAKHIKGKLVISLSAGVKLKVLKKCSRNRKIQFIRIMPNIAIADNQGVIGMFAGRNISRIQKKALFKVMQSLGYLFNTKREADLDALTVISACGPAIVSKFIEMVVCYGVKSGFSRAVAERIARQIFRGTFERLRQSKKSPSALIKMVATKGGVTETILKKLEKENFEKIFKTAMDAGKNKIERLKRMV